MKTLSPLTELRRNTVPSSEEKANMFNPHYLHMQLPQIH
jgi:hypothetical protein